MVKEKSKRAAYTLEFKREAVRLVEGGQGSDRQSARGASPDAGQLAEAQ